MIVIVGIFMKGLLIHVSFSRYLQGSDFADTLPMDVDDEASFALLRAKTLVLGEVPEDESPTKISPPDVQSGKAFASRADQQVEAAPADHCPPPVAELPNSGDASVATLEKSNSVQPPSEETTGLVKGAHAHQTLKPCEPEGVEHPTMKPDLMEGDLEGSKPDLMEVDPVHHVDQGTSKQSEPVKVDGTSKVRSDLKVDKQTPQPSQVEALAESEDAAPKVAPPADLKHNVDVDIDKIPMVKREEQQAFKGAKKANRGKGETEEGMEESEKPKPEPEPTKPNRRMKRPAAAKKKAEPKTKRQKTKKHAAPKDQEEECKEEDVRCKLDGKFQEVAEQQASDSDGTPAAAPAAADDKPEGTKRKGRKPKDTEDQGLRALPTGLKTKSGGDRSTFAGRAAPKSVQANNRFIVMLNTFSAKITPLLGKTTSQIEVRGLPKKHIAPSKS